MKNYNKLWLGAVAFFMMASCAEDSKLDFMVDKPESLAQLEYLNDYNVLKSYVDRNANPDFKLGAGVSVEDFNAKLRGYSLIVTNFDEVTAGWEMKHGGVVRDDGSLNTANVTSFIKTAREAGISIYGHTLVWHANQNAKYLNKTIAPTVIPGAGGPELFPSVITNSDFESNADGWGGWGNGSTRGLSAAGEGYNGGFAYTFTNPTVAAYYTAQVAHDFASPLENGSTYRLHFWVKASVAGAIRAEIQSTADYSSNGFGTFDVSTAWKEYTLETTLTKADRNRFLFSFGDFAGKVYVDKVTLCKVNPNYSGPSYDPSIITVSDFENGSAGWGGWGNGSTRGLSAAGEGFGGSGFAYTFTNPSAKNFWEAQTAYDFSALENGATYSLNFKVKASAAGKIRAEVQTSSDYSSDGFGTFDISTTWKEYTLEVITTKATRNRFLFSFGDFAGTVYIDDITLRRLNPSGGGDQIIVKTPEEKKQIITAEMDRWIKGMMDVSKDYVKAWDVVNEPMDDGNPSQLKTGVGKTLKADEFYWQDYMGKDYAVEAFKLAAQYGNSGDKLFINDYNLEYSIEKCKGLIAYVKYIEDNGGRVDGIGTQMHISTTTDKAKIAEMFTLLAQTGKLIKISELDLGIDNKKTEDCTDVDYQAQAEMYKFVVQKYFELIPAAQRYGITFWSPLDSPAGSGWRAGEPIGLWNKDYSRKRAFGGAADAFAGK